jgi:hypothetical protein
LRFSTKSMTNTNPWRSLANRRGQRREIQLLQDNRNDPRRPVWWGRAKGE